MRGIEEKRRSAFGGYFSWIPDSALSGLHRNDGWGRRGGHGWRVLSQSDVALFASRIRDHVKRSDGYLWEQGINRVVKVLYPVGGAGSWW